MKNTSETTDRSSKTRIRASWTMRGLVILFLAFDGAMKFVLPAPVVDAFAHLGIPISLAVPIGTILLACTALYAIPRTSVLGAILLTGYLGGAVMSHLRVGDPLFSHVLFPTYMGVLLWGGLFLRDAHLRALIPLRQDPESEAQSSATREVNYLSRKVSASF